MAYLFLCETNFAIFTTRPQCTNLVRRKYLYNMDLLDFSVVFSHPALTSPLPSLNTDQFQLRSTLARLEDFGEIHITKTAHRQKAQYDHHVQDRSFQVGDTVWLSISISGKLEPRWQGGARSNPSRDPTPTRLMIAQHHRLYTSTDYNTESNPNSEHYPTVPTSRIMGLCPGHPLLLRWCLKNLCHNHSIQSGITDLLTDYSSSKGQVPSGWDGYNTDVLDCSVVFQCIHYVFSIMHECSNTCTVEPLTRVLACSAVWLSFLIIVTWSRSTGWLYYVIFVTCTQIGTLCECPAVPL